MDVSPNTNVTGTAGDDPRLARLQALADSLCRTRADAISGRQASGIEDIWEKDEEFYEGVDERNRDEISGNLWRQKPPGAAQVETQQTTRSKVFPNITRPYVDAAAARIADMLLPTDDRAWSIRPTPVADLVALSKGEVPPQVESAIAQQFPNPEMAQVATQEAVEAAAKQTEEAKSRAEKAQKRIEDWHVECNMHAEVRQVIEDAARIGSGVLKGPKPDRKRVVAWVNGEIVMRNETKPVSKRIDAWNLFPDPACGENVHNGSFIWERDYLTKRQLEELKGTQGYIDSEIDACLMEGAQRATGEYNPGVPPSMANQKDRYEIWYGHCTVEKDDFEAAGCECPDDQPVMIPAMVTMVNNRVIKLWMNPMDTGEFPYDVFPWQKRKGSPWGIGVARQGRTAQRIVTAATRNLMDNAGLAGGPMLVMKQGMIYPADGKAGIAPRKIWYIGPDAEGLEDATKAIGTIKVDMLVNELMVIVQFGLKLMEDVTGLPMLLQGQQGDAPDTLGGQQMMMNNASSVLRRLAKLFDDYITEPHVRRWYHWLLQHGEDAEKGDYCIDARGSSALVEREIQNQELAQMGNIVLNPVFGLDPRKWIQEYLKSRHFDPKRFEFDDEQWKQIVENMSKGPQDPRLAVEQLRGQVQERLAQFNATVQQQMTAMEQNFEAQENSRDRALDVMLAEFERAGNKSITLDELKGKLGETAMKLRTQRELGFASLRSRNAQAASKQVTKPPTEPAGKAPAGQAFQR